MKCENCEKEHEGIYGSGRFCTKECARGFSTKEKRSEINKKVSEKLSTSINKICPICGVNFENQLSRNGVYCSNTCSAKNRWLSDIYKKEMSDMSRKRCSTIEERIRMKEIGRKGGFGKKGHTKGNVRYESNLEQKCFEYLEGLNIAFIPHKNIPNSSKVSDIYLIDKDLWVEIDGIDREKRKKWLKENYIYWLEKLEIYKLENLKMIIIKKFSELKNLIENN